MTTAPRVDVLVPELRSVGVSELLESISALPPRKPYSDDTVEMCSRFSQRLSRAAGRDPALQALAFWMRGSELRRLQAIYESFGDERVAMAPRGLAFHLPPANVDTIFVYSWLLSVLAGNTNVIRISPDRTGVTDRILDVLNDVLGDRNGLPWEGYTAVVSYGHDEEVTAAFSAACDVRVIWGGDQTVRTIRSIPVAPQAKELTFADRISLAVINSLAYLAATSGERASLAERLYNDAYLFDQLACSSPRLIVWVGDRPAMASASALLLGDLEKVLRTKEYRVDTSTAIAKMTYRARAAIDFPVERQEIRGNELAVLTVPEPVDAGPDFCGAGMFWETSVPTLADLAGHLGRRHQTLAHFGFDPAELTDLARRLNGRGVDRMVPVGEALTFNRYWDGLDLMREFLRAVFVQGELRTR
jgi:hypothetical protein